VLFRSRMQYTGLYLDKLEGYQGSNCDDYKVFLSDDVKDKTLSYYLSQAEDGSHGPIHFAFGGSGGDTAASVDAVLMSAYGFTAFDIIVIARNAQSFFKLASCKETYFETAETLLQLITLFFAQGSGSNVMTYLHSGENTFAEKKEVMTLICSRDQHDSEMEGSGAATDPLFWVAHGAIERLFQAAIFNDITADTAYPTDTTDLCSGHAIDGTKAWLEGFYLEDESVNTYEITNGVLTEEVLNPTTTSYKNYISYVYDRKDFSFCPDSESWFA